MLQCRELHFKNRE